MVALAPVSEPTSAQQEAAWIPKQSLSPEVKKLLLTYGYWKIINGEFRIFPKVAKRLVDAGKWAFVEIDSSSTFQWNQFINTDELQARAILALDNIKYPGSLSGNPLDMNHPERAAQNAVETILNVRYQG